jgi:hypothetical protein
MQGYPFYWYYLILKESFVITVVFNRVLIFFTLNINIISCYSLDLKCPQKVCALNVWHCRAFRRFSLMGGPEVIGSMPWRGIVHSGIFLSLCSLTHDEPSGFVPPYTSVMMCCLTTGPKWWGQSIMGSIL